MPSFMERMVEEYPDIAHIGFGIENLYVITNAELVRLLLVEHTSSLEKAPALKGYSSLLGSGLLTSEGEFWRRQRRFVQPGFHQKRIKDYAQDIVALTRQHEESWADGRNVDISADMSALTLTIVVRALFGDDMGPQAGRFAESLTEVLVGSGRWMLPGAQWTRRIPTQRHRRSKKATLYLDHTVAGLVNSRRADGTGDDVLTMLLGARDAEGSGMSDQQVRDEVMTLILAGHETTAMALTWAWMLLSMHPACRRAFHREIDGMPEEQSLTFDDVPRLTFTRAVFAEALRLYPPAWLMGRKLSAQIELGGWKIPRGATVVVPVWALHRSDRYWSNGDVFDPSRWLGDDGRFADQNPDQPGGAWLPFGMGQRKCVGSNFAWAEGVLILATLARQWDVVLRNGNIPELTPAITLRPAGGMPVRLTRR